VTAFPEPTGGTADAAVLFSRYLDFYRQTVLGKLRALSATDLRATRLPSDWTPLELLSHLAHMEQRWLVWGFLGEDVANPWGDARDDRWYVAEEVELEQLAADLEAVGRRTSQVLAEHPLDELGHAGGRFDDDPPTLGWICFHVMQEYARHAGHLDIAVELAGGPLGE
jgi:uncharacterized damage-inducible protein DinB